MDILNKLIAIPSIHLVIMAAIGAVSAMMANRNIAVFHDGLRPLVPEYVEGRISRKALAATSFALSFGLVIGFGIPFSLTAPIILVHSLLLGTDVIGTWTPDNKKGFIISGIFGALYAIALMIGLKSVIEIFAAMPVNFISALSKVGDPIVACFAIFPALVISYQFGYKKGMWVLVATIVGYALTKSFGDITFSDPNTKPVKIDPNGVALLFSMIAMFYFAMREKAPPLAEGQKGSNEMLVGLFSERVKRIQKKLAITCT